MRQQKTVSEMVVVYTCNSCGKNFGNRKHNLNEHRTKKKQCTPSLHETHTTNVHRLEEIINGNVAKEASLLERCDELRYQTQCLRECQDDLQERFNDQKYRFGELQDSFNTVREKCRLLEKRCDGLQSSALEQFNQMESINECRISELNQQEVYRSYKKPTTAHLTTPTVLGMLEIPALTFQKFITMVYFSPLVRQNHSLSLTSHSREELTVRDKSTHWSSRKINSVFIKSLVKILLDFLQGWNTTTILTTRDSRMYKKFVSYIKKSYPVDYDVTTIIYNNTVNFLKNS